jgi:hypothetical protein
LYQEPASDIITFVRTSPEGGAPMIDMTRISLINGGADFAPAGGCSTDAA